MMVGLDFKGLGEKDIEKFISLFKWKSWSYSALDDELRIEVEPKDFFPSEVLPRLKRVGIVEEEEIRDREIER